MTVFDYYAITHLISGVLGTVAYIVIGRKLENPFLYGTSLKTDGLCVLWGMLCAGVLSPLVLFVCYYHEVPGIKKCVKRGYYFPTKKNEYEYIQRLLSNE